MKKSIYCILLFISSISISAQSYEQYKKEKEYAQRYRNEQQAQFNKQLNEALNRFNTLTNKYVSLVVQRESIDYVNYHYPDLNTKRSLLHAQLLSVSNQMNNSQLGRFQYNVTRFNNLYNNYNR